jgi:hypothetical protein
MTKKSINAFFRLFVNIRFEFQFLFYLSPPLLFPAVDNQEGSYSMCTVTNHNAFERTYL